MNVVLGIWDKLSRAVVVLLFVAALLGVVVWDLPLIRQNENYRRAILQYQAKIKREEDRQRQMESAIRALRTDARTIERVAREKLGYIKPGEFMIRFD